MEDSVTSKWDKTSKPDFDKAARNEPTVQPPPKGGERGDPPGKHDALGDGPKPPSGKRAPTSSNTAWDRKAAAKNQTQAPSMSGPKLGR